MTTSSATTLIQLTVLGEPVAKARPRLGVRGHTYTPRRTVHGEEKVLSYLKAWYPALRPAEGCFSVSVDCYFKGAPKVDVDNLLKLVLDALNRRVWHDDSAVVQAYVRKHLRCPAPRTEITVHQLHEAA